MDVGVDVGGTFTDFAGFLGRELVTTKVPSTLDPSRAGLSGMPELGAEGKAHGTTVATNAILQRKGGNGVRRSVRILAPSAAVSVIAERRRHAPRGLQGGDDAQPGRNLLVHAGRTRALPDKVTFDVRRGDVLVVEAPGGGGWGALRSET